MASRGHRLSIYNPQFKVAGVAIGSHKVFGQMVVVNLCAEFEPDAGKIQARKKSGPPLLEEETGAGSASATAKTTKKKTKIKTQVRRRLSIYLSVLRIYNIYIL